MELTTEAGEVSRAGFEHALIAVGTRPHRPENVPFDRKRVFDSDEILELETLPRTLTVIGGGVIGVEYATIFSALDVPVTLIEPRDTILDFVDREIVDDFVHQMRDRGMTVRLGIGGGGDRGGPRGVEVTLADGRRGALGDPALRRRAHGQRRGAEPRGRSASRSTPAGG